MSITHSWVTLLMALWMDILHLKNCFWRAAFFHLPHSREPYKHCSCDSKRCIFNVIENVNDEKSQQFIWITQIHSHYFLGGFFFSVHFLWGFHQKKKISHLSWLRILYERTHTKKKRKIMTKSTHNFFFDPFFIFFSEMDDMFLEYNTNTIYVLNATYRYGVSWQPAAAKKSTREPINLQFLIKKQRKREGEPEIDEFYRCRTIVTWVEPIEMAISSVQKWIFFSFHKIYYFTHLFHLRVWLALCLTVINHEIFPISWWWKFCGL